MPASLENLSGADRAGVAGRYSDGRTAVSRHVRVALTKSALQIERGDGTAPLTWPLAGIETAESLTRRSVDVLIHEPGRGGATVFVPDAKFVRELAVRAPRLTMRTQRWRVARVWVWLTAAAGIIGLIATTTDISPARAIAGLMPHKTRVLIGKQVISSMSGGHSFCDAPAGKAALDTLVAKLSAANGSKKKFDVKVVDSGVVNAFAAPGEQVVIMRGVLDKAESADEVAGVLAHEMGHGIELHPEAGIVRIVGLVAITEFIFGGSGGTLANVGLLLTSNGYSRQAERQADAHALSTLKEAHISTAGLAAFFRRVAKISSESTDEKKEQDASDIAVDMFRTHPSIMERLKTIEAEPPYPATPALDPAQWRAFKSICGAGAGGAGGATPKPPSKTQGEREHNI